MASESIVEAELIDDFSPEGIIPQNTAEVKFNVRGGKDRTERPRISTTYTLNGQPSIQGVEIRSSINVNLYLWGSTNGTGDPERIIQGPTGNQHKFTAVKIGSYRVEPR